MHLVRLFILVIAPLIALGISPLSARAGELAGSGEINISADVMKLDKEKDLLEAEGNVEVRWDQYILRSDTAVVDHAQSQAVAEGRVSLWKEGYSLMSDRIELNYETELGVASNANLFVKPRNFHLRGDRFLKTDEDTYHLERGFFTTCDGERPSWKFSASELEVTVDEYAKGKNAVFYISDIPVFYFPYIVFPVKRERQSGFLFPKIGSSTKKGFYLDVPYYWAISPSQDLTVDIDEQTRRGTGIGVDYRYLRGGGSHGEFNGYLIYDTKEDRGRGYFTLKGHEYFSPSLVLTSDVNLTLDRDFFRDYGEASGDYNRQILTSSFFATKRMEHSSLTGEIRYVHDLDAPNNDETLQKLPVLTFTRARTPIWTSLYFGLDSSFTNFYREEGIRGQRLSLHPVLAYYYSTPQGIDVSAWAGYHQRIYNGTGADKGEGYHGDGVIDAGATVSTSLARVYGLQQGEFSAVRHTLIPELSYSFIQDKNQDRLPFFDWEDNIAGQGLVTWSLTNFLTGKYFDSAGTPRYRDVLYFRISQGYLYEGTRRDLLTLVDEGRPLSDIRLEALYAPIPLFSVTTDSRYNPHMTRFSTATLGFGLNDHDGNQANLNYHFAREEVEYAEGKATISLLKPFTFNYSGRYSFDKKGFLETFYSVEYKRQCWSIGLSYRDRPDNRAFVLSFTLAGVGAIGPVKAF